MVVEKFLCGNLNCHLGLSFFDDFNIPLYEGDLLLHLKELRIKMHSVELREIIILFLKLEK